MRFIDYIKKYCDFYLSKYSVTKTKFEDILKQKIKKDFFKKKISTEEYQTFLKQVTNVLEYYVELGLFNEKLLIKNKIQTYLRKGYSFLKIKKLLIKDRFKEQLINKEIEDLNSDCSLNEILIERFIKKKINLSKYNNANTSNKALSDKIMSSLIQNGFEYESCKTVLSRYLDKC